MLAQIDPNTKGIYRLLYVGLGCYHFHENEMRTCHIYLAKPFKKHFMLFCKYRVVLCMVATNMTCKLSSLQSFDQSVNHVAILLEYLVLFITCKRNVNSFFEKNIHSHNIVFLERKMLMFLFMPNSKQGRRQQDPSYITKQVTP